jgi:aspartokinase/homoserine dehydrogenase 1
MRILKFGGSSLAEPDRIKTVINIISRSKSLNGEISVVVSAQAGITDYLGSLCDLIPANAPECEAAVRKLELQYLDFVKKLLPVATQPSATAEIMAMCNELSGVVKGASLVGEVTSRTRDLILSFGERLSAFLLTQALKQEIPEAYYVDARELIRTDLNFGKAKIDFEITNKLIQEHYSNKKRMFIVTGFIASSEHGETTTLGRNGSDYTASVLGAALNAEAIEIWTDVDGVMTTDPRYVSDTQSITQLSYNEAMELSHFGARVLYPASLQPAMARKIPILVKNTFNPDHKGTLICSESSKDNGFIKGIASLSDISLINIEGSGMVGVVGVSARLFSALSQENVSVILISQASSEHSICVAVMQKDAEKSNRILNGAFREELSLGLISSIKTESNLSIVAVVGENMRYMPGVAARVFTPLGRNGINIKAISQGSSELNISFVIDGKEIRKALRVLHQSLFNRENRQLNLYIAGTGQVGSRLLDMIKEHNDYLVKNKIDLQLCGMINSSKMVISDNRLDLGDWEKLIKVDSEKADLQEFVGRMINLNKENSLFIDVTAAEEPIVFYNRILSENISIVAANKRANTQNMNEYRKLHDVALKRNVSFHYETNVGAGLPVINVLRKLISGGDKVISIEAVLSGTINWLLSEYDGSKPFSELVRIAKERGYTEPDPRDDLSGMDVARKCLILAREAGLDIELENIYVDALMLPDIDPALDLESFFRESKPFDQLFDARYKKALDEGKKLRYIAKIENGSAKVELEGVGGSNSFFTLQGSENCIILTTRYYQQTPMVIRGPGAGVDVTAAGMLADIVRIAEDVRI